MPLFDIQVKADLDNLDELKIVRSGDSGYFLDLEFQGGEERKNVFVTKSESQEVGRASFNLVITQKGAKSASTINITKELDTPYKAGDDFVTVVQFECRGGVSITNWVIDERTEFQCENENGSYPLELEEGEFYSVDDSNESISVTNIETRVTAGKK